MDKKKIRTLSIEGEAKALTVQWVKGEGIKSIEYASTTTPEAPEDYPLPGDDHYILDENGIPVVTHSLKAWGELMRDSQRRAVKQEEIEIGDKKYYVSTVFLAMNYNWMGIGCPILWETMVFDRSDTPDDMNDEYCDRYTSREAALTGHEETVARLKAGTLWSDED